MFWPAACQSDHHVSPWPEGFGLESLVQPPDLKRHLERVDQELALERMTRTEEVRGQFSDRSQFVVLAFSGLDGVKRARAAVRVATGYGVILALGPHDAADLVRGKRTHLVASLADGGGWKSGTDLNGDGNPDVVVRGEDGTLEVWCLMPKGASPYAIKSLVAPDHAIDLDSDGMPDLAARVVLARDDAIAPVVVEASSFEGGEYRSDSAAVKHWHARQLQEMALLQADAGAQPDRVVLAGAIERAWHAFRSGAQPLGRALEAADATVASRAPLGPGLSQSWVRWRGWLSDLGK